MTTKQYYLGMALLYLGSAVAFGLQIATGLFLCLCGIAVLLEEKP